WLAALQIQVLPFRSVIDQLKDEAGSKAPEPTGTKTSGVTPYRAPTLGWLFVQSLIGSGALGLWYALFGIILGLMIAGIVALCGAEVHWLQVILGCSFFGLIGLVAGAFVHLKGFENPEYWQKSGETAVGRVRRYGVGVLTVAVWFGILVGIGSFLD